MQQSHWGAKLDPGKRDRLAIIVDKTTSPLTAKFYQLAPGEMQFDETQQISYRVSCFLCHANGPRAIRPNFNSSLEISFKNKIKIALWNLKIKTYGKVTADESVGIKSKIPFKSHNEFDNQPLEVKTCLKCHNDGAWPARGKLTRQQFMPITFLVSNGEMPPPGFRLSSVE